MVHVRTQTRRIAPTAKASGVLATLGFCIALASILDTDLAYAEDGLQPGEAYVTRFSGTVTQDGQVAIDTSGIVGSAIDIRAPGKAPHGAPWSGVARRLAVTAGKVGQVFGIALDDANPPNIYLTATSAFGLHRTPDNADWMAGMWGQGGGPGTVWKLDAPDGYRPSVFATITLDGRANTGAALGNIAYDKRNKQLYVSDLETGMIHRFGLDGQDLGHFDHGTAGRTRFVDAVTGAQSSLPEVAFDPNSAAKISDCPGGVFSQTPECWNLADFRRRIWGLGVRQNQQTGEVRLYYAIWGSEGLGNSFWATAGDDQRNAVWSVRIGPDGDFDTSDVRREFILPNFFSEPGQIATLGASHPVSDIAFPKFGDQTVMLLAERGGVRNISLAAAAPFARPNESRVLRYELDAYGVWLPAGRYDVGFYDRKNHSQPYLRVNSSGGVDFGLGYSADWKAEQAQPDQFVWITGDSLCSPEGPCVDPATGSATDTARVDGVQGTPVALSNDLEPAAGFELYPPTGYATPDATPAGSYMIDVYPGGEPARNDATKIGDVAVYQPLPEGVAEGWMPPGWIPPGLIAPPGYTPPSGWVPPPGWTPPSGWTPPPDWTPPPWWPLPPPVPPVVPAGVDLEVAKSTPGNTCPSNAACKFAITITNKGTQAYLGPLDLTDTLPQGWKLVSASAPWTCWQQGDAFACTHPQTTLAPGQSVKLDVELQPPGAAAGQPVQVKVDNCVNIDWKGGAGDGNMANDGACVTVTFSAAAFDLELKKAMPSVGVGPGAATLEACDPTKTCRFQVTLTNKGPGTYSGPLNVKDTTPAGWKFISVSTPSAPWWTCKYEQLGDIFSCTRSLTTLAPGQSVTLDVELLAAPAPGGISAEVENCAEIDWKGGAGDTNKDNDRGCQKLTVGAFPPDLQITKSGPSKCARNATCSYTVTITNVGQGPYQGPISFEEPHKFLTGLTVKTVSPSPPWTCTDAQLVITCEHQNATLAPGSSLTLNLELFFPADVPASWDALHNCVKITKTAMPGIYVPLSKPESCIDTPLQAEFDLKATKMGPAKCFKPGPCSFTLSVLNAGKGDYEGPITITETTQYPNKLNSFKPSPPWTCTESAGKAAWPTYEVTCTHPWVKLPWMKLPLPLTLELGLHDTNQTEVKNCAKVSYKGGPDADPSNDEVCITTPLEPSAGKLTGGKGGGGPSKLALDIIFGPFCWVFCTNYEFVISNSGPATYPRPMTLRVELPEGAKVNSTRGTQSGKSCSAAGWSCELSGKDMICRPSACSLAKDEKTAVLFDLQLLPDGFVTPPEGTSRTVCGELEWFAPPSDAIDIEQQMGAKRISRACGTTKILGRKEFDLALKKSGPAECSAGGTCSYSLTVSNMSQAPFSGRIKFIDTLPSGWELSSSGNTKCTQQGDVVACERPQLTLQPGWTGAIRIEAQVPAKENRSEVENCAWLDYGKGQGDASPANDRSCVKTKLKGVSPAEECKNKGWIWDRRNQRCVPPPSPAEECRKKGWVWDRRSRRCVPTMPECTGGKVRVGERCLCPPNTVEVRGQCRLRKAEEPSQPPPATTPQIKIIPAQPFQIICPSGTKWSEPNKKCLPAGHRAGDQR